MGKEERLMVTKILDHLYLGDWNDAQKFEGEIISVTQEIMSIEPEKAYWIPVIRVKGNNPIDWDRLIGDQEVGVFALKHQIDLVTFMIDKNIKLGMDTIVHCLAGIERSPLVIACYLHKYQNMSWDEAYDFIKEKRPEVANRLQWLNLSYNERMS